MYLPSSRIRARRFCYGLLLGTIHKGIYFPNTPRCAVYRRSHHIFNKEAQRYFRCVSPPAAAFSRMHICSDVRLYMSICGYTYLYVWGTYPKKPFECTIFFLFSPPPFRHH
ncbi:hypothetical protein POVWA2_045360 [Plasmodium ovale wallikeri]|uniref:Uncharacterized protein n=1 Tax=Plasmodium ovale wallikeri TaxID=864142 RepID=A0A1A8ZH60_PLAOA|nr:hypothetical protein POVWA1_046480 [Plasmodium ovale wallikeri]SBT43209.1 hypothetical protein POVWA2_045360 [Plasmodium ovale wallikeri]